MLQASNILTHRFELQVTPWKKKGFKNRSKTTSRYDSVIPVHRTFAHFQSQLKLLFLALDEASIKLQLTG
jgi:hypothetical protein